MKDMTKGNPFKMILMFAFPLLLGNLLQQFYNLADASIVGKFLGPDALASVGATSSVQFLILGFCMGSCTGFCVPVAQKYGAGDYVSMRRLIFHSAFLALSFALVFTSACTLLCPQILRALSIPENIWKDTYIYILIIFLGIPFTLLYNLAAGILRAIGDSRTPFIFLGVSTVLNILLDLFCIAVLGWGCAGAAIATIVSQGLSGGLCTWVIIRKYEILHIQKEERSLSGTFIKTLLMMGVPMGLQFSITAIGSMLMQSAINGLGSLYASAFTASVRIKSFAMCPFDAIATGVSTFCSQNFGAGNAKRIRLGYRIGMVSAAVYGTGVGILLFLFGRTACMLFLSANETEILDASALYLRYNAFFFGILGLLNVSRITVQGLGFSGRAIFSGVMEMIARAMTAFLLVPALGFQAVCIADPAAWIAADIYIIPMCLYTLHKVQNMLAERNSMAEKTESSIGGLFGTGKKGIHGFHLKKRPALVHGR